MPSKRPKCTHVVAAAVLGLEGSGKTTLVKQLRGHSETGALLAYHELDVTPTAGMELDTWQHGSTKIKVKDVGGAFAGSWPKYLKGVDTLVYVVDLSNPMQLGTATIELFHLLVDPGMARAPVSTLRGSVSSSSLHWGMPATTGPHPSAGRSVEGGPAGHLRGCDLPTVRPGRQHASLQPALESRGVGGDRLHGSQHGGPSTVAPYPPPTPHPSGLTPFPLFKIVSLFCSKL